MTWAKHLYDAGFPIRVSSCLEIDMTGCRSPGRKDISLLGAVIGASPVLFLYSDPIPFQSRVLLEHGTSHPTVTVATFEKFLDGISNWVRRCLPLQVLVLEDLNAHPLHSGNSRTHVIGRTLSDWAPCRWLLLINRGSISTYVTRRGCFVEDIT